MKEKIFAFNEYILTDFITFISGNLETISRNLQSLEARGQASRDAVLNITKDYQERLQQLVTDYNDALISAEQERVTQSAR